MGYTARYPGGWTVFKATEPCLAGQDDRRDAPNGDRIENAETEGNVDRPFLPAMLATIEFDPPPMSTDHSCRASPYVLLLRARRPPGAPGPASGAPLRDPGLDFDLPRPTLGRMARVDSDEGHLQGPPARGPLGNLREYAAAPLEAFRRWNAGYDDAVRLRFGPQAALLLTSPEAAEDVLVNQAHAFRKAPIIRQLAEPVIGHSVFTAEGEDWRRQRACLEPFFASDRMEALVPTIATHVRAMVATWTPGRVIETLAETMAMSQRIGGQALFGATVSDSDVARVRAALDVTSAAFQHGVGHPLSVIGPRWLPTPSRRRVRRAIRELDSIASALIQGRRRYADGGPDLLGQLLREQDASWLTDRLIRDNVVTLIVDSRENPGLLLTWALYLLARHPDIADRLAAEARDVLGDGEVGPSVTRDLSLTGQVLRETLRLYPPVYSTGRQAVRDCTVAGIRVSRGTIVLLSQFVTHRSARWFNRPDEFLPDRWEGGYADSLPDGAYAPFNIGQRRCLGENLAWVVGLIGLSILMKERRFELVEPEPVEPSVLLSLRPAREVLLRVLPGRAQTRITTDA